MHVLLCCFSSCCPHMPCVARPAHSDDRPAAAHQKAASASTSATKLSKESTTWALANAAGAGPAHREAVPLSQETMCRRQQSARNANTVRHGACQLPAGIRQSRACCRLSCRLHNKRRDPPACSCMLVSTSWSLGKLVTVKLSAVGYLPATQHSTA